MDEENYELTLCMIITFIIAAVISTVVVLSICAAIRAGYGMQIMYYGYGIFLAGVAMFFLWNIASR